MQRGWKWKTATALHIANRSSTPRSVSHCSLGLPYNSGTDSRVALGRWREMQWSHATLRGHGCHSPYSVHTVQLSTVVLRPATATINRMSRRLRIMCFPAHAGRCTQLRDQLAAHTNLLPNRRPPRTNLPRHQAPMLQPPATLLLAPCPIWPCELSCDLLIITRRPALRHS